MQTAQAALTNKLGCDMGRNMRNKRRYIYPEHVVWSEQSNYAISL